MHYTSLFNAIRDGVNSAWSPSVIMAGRAPKPEYDYDRVAITLESVERQNVGRSVLQTWKWSIAGDFAISAGVTPQQYAATKAEALIAILAPFNESSPPTPPSLLGGVGSMRKVTEWTPVPKGDDENSIGLVLSFEVTTQVWQ